jgi:DNA-binding HxlR family transcriptional regulator
MYTAAMAKRTYAQFCPAARALDFVGERWTLLIVRELLFSGRRYTDLMNALPGVGPNVLAERLRALEESGLVVKRRLPPPAASTVYELTELGRELEPVFRALFIWGLNLHQPAAGESREIGWLLDGIRAMPPSPLAVGVRESYEFRIGTDVVHVDVANGEIAAGEGSAKDPALVVTADLMTFLAVARGSVSAEEAVTVGRMKVEGDPEPAARCAAIFSTAPARLPA